MGELATSSDLAQAAVWQLKEALSAVNEVALGMQEMDTLDIINAALPDWLTGTSKADYFSRKRARRDAAKQAEATAAASRANSVGGYGVAIGEMEVFSPWSGGQLLDTMARKDEMLKALIGESSMTVMQDIADVSREALLSVEDVASTVSNTFADAITNATSLQSAIATVAQSLERMVLQRAMEMSINSAMGGGSSIVSPELFNQGFTQWTPQNEPLGSMGNPAPARIAAPSITIVGDATSTARMLTTNTKLIRAMNQAYKQGYPSE
jgi:hypothetical protein